MDRGRGLGQNPDAPTGIVERRDSGSGHLCPRAHDVEQEVASIGEEVRRLVRDVAFTSVERRDRNGIAASLGHREEFRLAVRKQDDPDEDQVPPEGRYPTDASARGPWSSRPMRFSSPSAENPIDRLSEDQNRR
jgi:hypothetical protein